MGSDISHMVAVEASAPTDPEKKEKRNNKLEESLSAMDRALARQDEAILRQKEATCRWEESLQLAKLSAPASEPEVPELQQEQEGEASLLPEPEEVEPLPSPEPGVVIKREEVRHPPPPQHQPPPMRATLALFCVGSVFKGATNLLIVWRTVKMGSDISHMVAVEASAPTDPEKKEKRNNKLEESLSAMDRALARQDEAILRQKEATCRWEESLQLAKLSAPASEPEVPELQQEQEGEASLLPEPEEVEPLPSPEPGVVIKREEVRHPPPPQHQPPPMRATLALVSAVLCPMLQDTLPMVPEFLSLNLVPGSVLHQAHFLNLSDTTVPLQPQMWRRVRQTLLKLSLPVAVLPLVVQRSLHWCQASELCLLYHTPGLRSAHQSPLSPRRGPSLLVQGTLLWAQEEELTHPQVRPWKKVKTKEMGHEGGWSFKGGGKWSWDGRYLVKTRERMCETGHKALWKKIKMCMSVY
ncbi:UNVERIFIED_CONTAM: hypothetical protein FKN15_064482 [Acipenser sinensis]